MNLLGRWRIASMDMWDREAIDLMAPGSSSSMLTATGEFGFIAVSGSMDCRPVERDGRAGVEFSWIGGDEGDDVSRARLGGPDRRRRARRSPVLPSRRRVRVSRGISTAT